MARPDYDAVIIGGGTTGIVSALIAAWLGARVVLVEADRTGGDCLYTGCVPSKALLASAKRAHAMRNAGDVGIEPVEPEIDFARVMDRVQSVIEEISGDDSPEYLGSQGVEVLLDRARFDGPGRVVTDGGRTLTYRMALIATGSTPVIPPIEGLAACDPLTNKTVWDLRNRPGRLAVIGGGPIGCELGQAFSRLGSEVTLVEGLPRLLAREEPQASELIRSVFEGEGIDVVTDVVAESAKSYGNGSGALSLSDGTSVEFDRVLVAAGRRPATEGLGLDSVGVDLDESGAVIHDEKLRTTGKNIYVGGDVSGEVQFTHVAGYHALIAVANGLFRAQQKVERHWVPRVTYTDPEIASAGMIVEEAKRELGRDPELFDYDHADLDRAQTESQRGFSKLLAGKGGKLIGATVAGPAAGEVIGEAARLIREDDKVADLSQMIHAYPTYSEGPARAADEWWKRRYFTPTLRRFVFRPILAIARRLDRPS